METPLNDKELQVIQAIIEELKALGTRGEQSRVLNYLQNRTNLYSEYESPASAAATKSAF